MTYIEYGIIAILFIIQLFIFLNVRKNIIKFRRFFPKSFKGLQIIKYQVPKTVLDNPETFETFLETFSSDSTEYFEKIDEVELLVMTQEMAEQHPEFKDVIKSTNMYLCKNKGASADFNILQDTCERHLQKVDNEIGNVINVPLYIGLAGTFLGVIVGLGGIDFSGGTDGNVVITTSSVDQLLKGVMAAMIASLSGLVFTVWNTAGYYKPAAFVNETDKNHYYDFIQRELLPVLNVGMAGSLTTFRSVLDHFIVRFGENIDDYKESAQLLNKNLRTQQTVLEEINKLDLVKTSNQIAKTFISLKESSEHLDTFKVYQTELNDYLSKAENVAKEINETITHYKNFNNKLDILSQQSLATYELERQFKESLEKHFPVISDIRETWRNQIDELNKDVETVYHDLNEYFKSSTKQIENFLNENGNFFQSIQQIQSSIQIFVENSVIQNDQFKLLQEGILGIRNDMKESQRVSIDTNIQILNALKGLNNHLSKMAIAEEKL